MGAGHRRMLSSIILFVWFHATGSQHRHTFPLLKIRDFVSFRFSFAGMPATIAFMVRGSFSTTQIKSFAVPPLWAREGLQYSPGRRLRVGVGDHAVGDL